MMLPKPTRRTRCPECGRKAEIGDRNRIKEHFTTLGEDCPGAGFDVRQSPRRYRKIERYCPPRPQRKGTIAGLKRKLDRIWSQKIRTRDGRCMVKVHKVLTSRCKGVADADHLFGKKKLRWDLSGGARICRQHHRVVTFDQASHATLGLRMLGPAKYQELLFKANNDRGRHTYKRPELEEVLASLTGS